MQTEGGRKLAPLKTPNAVFHFFARLCQSYCYLWFCGKPVLNFLASMTSKTTTKSSITQGPILWWPNLTCSNFKIKSGSGARKFRHIGAKKWAMAPAIFKCRQLPPTLCRQRLLLQPPFHEFLQTRVEQNACLHDFSDTFSPSAQPTNLSHKN